MEDLQFARLHSSITVIDSNFGVLMAGKRTAAQELNHTNWDEEEEREDAGTFAKASEDVIKNREIKIAKRRNPIGSVASSDEEKKGTFVNFSGFAKSSNTPTSSPFNFLSNLTNKSGEQAKSNGLNNAPTNNFKKPIVSVTTVEKLPLKEADLENSGKSEEYFAKIKGLNQSVSKWIQMHVDTNPFLNLTPIFRDYEKYLEDIERLQVDSDIGELRESDVSIGFKMLEENKPAKLNFTFNKSKSDEVSERQSHFKFGLSSSNTTIAKSDIKTASFSFGGSASSEKPFTFANVMQPEKTFTENNEDEDVPPKVEFTPVIEDGHIYTIRCKVFVKKDDSFSDRGVGNLFLKPVADSDKIQLIVRADTNLGHVTCNFLLSKNIPIQRLGKKDVMLVCLPTPEHKPPPVPLLFRVKSTEDADELLKVLEKHKK